MSLTQYKIVVEIVVECIDSIEDIEGAKAIAQQYADMAQKYKSIAAIESNVMSVERV